MSEVTRRVASDLDSEISRNDARSAAAYTDRRRNRSSGYYWDRRRNLPTIEFSFYGGSKSVLSRIYVSEVLTVRGRAGKWMRGGLNYRFERGLAPGVEVPIAVAPRLFITQTAKQAPRQRAYIGPIGLDIRHRTAGLDLPETLSVATNAPATIAAAATA